MLSTVITVLLLSVMLLIIASLIISALRERRNHVRALATQGLVPTNPLHTHVTAIVHLHNGMVVAVEKPEPPPTFTLPSSWYTRRRTLVSAGFLLMVLLTLFMQSGLADGALQSWSQTFSFLSYSHPTDIHPPAHTVPPTASQLLVRVDSAARDQYYTDYQWHVWSYTSCSGIALEMVMNAYGRHLIAADVLQVELNLGVWDVRLGLLREDGIALTANYFGFNTSASHSRTLQDLITLSNKGIPIIVSVRDSYNFPGGHIFVVRGGDSQYIYIADSSPGDFQQMTYATFLTMWQNNGNFSAILSPR